MHKYRIVYERNKVAVTTHGRQYFPTDTEFVKAPNATAARRMAKKKPGWSITHVFRDWAWDRRR